MVGVQLATNIPKTSGASASTTSQSEDQLLTLAMAARAPGNTTPEVASHDWKLARELGIRISVHVGMRLTGVHVNHVLTLHQLGPDGARYHLHPLHRLDRRGARSDRQHRRLGIGGAVRRDVDGPWRAADRAARRARRPALAEHRRGLERAGRDVHADADRARAGAHPRVHRDAGHRVRADVDAPRRAGVRDDRGRARLRARSQGRHAHAGQAGGHHPDPDRSGQRRADHRSGGDRRHLRRHLEHRHRVRRRPAVKRNGQLVGVDMSRMVRLVERSRDYLLGQSGLLPDWLRH